MHDILFAAMAVTAAAYLIESIWRLTCNRPPSGGSTFGDVLVLVTTALVVSTFTRVPVVVQAAILVAAATATVIRLIIRKRVATG